MNFSNQIFPSREAIIKLAGKLRPIPETEEYFEVAEYADDLLQVAYESESTSKSINSARDAYSIDPFNSDALLHLAQVSKLSNSEKLMYLHEALRISIGKLPEDYFSSNSAPFWLDHETRPFMRALHCLGIQYCEVNMLDFTEFYWSFALDLNPNDNQGIRYGLVDLLLRQNKTNEAKVILEKYDEQTAQLSYSRLLLGLLQSSSDEKLDQLWDVAYKSNQYVPKLLINRTMPRYEGPYGIGDETEALVYTSQAWMTWDIHKEARSWLKRKHKVSVQEKLKEMH